MGSSFVDIPEGQAFLYDAGYLNSVKSDCERDRELMKQIAERVRRRYEPLCPIARVLPQLLHEGAGRSS
jgi:hypothetical protein